MLETALPASNSFLALHPAAKSSVCLLYLKYKPEPAQKTNAPKQPWERVVSSFYRNAYFLLVALGLRRTGAAGAFFPVQPCRVSLSTLKTTMNGLAV